MKNPKIKQVKKPMASLGFFKRSKKKTAIWFKIGGRFVTEKKYLEFTGISKSELEFAKQSNIENLQTRNGFLKDKQKEIAKELINEFLNNKDLRVQKYSLYIYATSERSFSVLKGKQIVLNGNNITFNELRYFFAKLLDLIGRVFYSRVKVDINEKTNTAEINISVDEIIKKDY